MSYNSVKKVRAYRQKLHNERKNKNLCLDCATPLQDLNHALCIQCRTAKRIYGRKTKLAAIEAYGGKCACCGETRIEFLTIDHIDNGGSKHRKEIGHRPIGQWLKNHGYPAGFQVLCWNCNCSKEYFGYCPHKSASRETL